MAGLGGLGGTVKPQDQDHMEPDADERGGASDGDMDNAEANASPEEQEAYDTFVNAALDVLYPKGEDRVSPLIIEDLKGQIDPKILALFDGAQPPVDTAKPQDMVAALTVMLVLLIDDKLGYAEKARGGGRPAEAAEPSEPGMRPGMPESDEPGGTEPIDYAAVTIHAGAAIAEELMEIAEAAKVHDFSDQDIEGVTFRAMDLYNVAGRNGAAKGYDQAALTAEFEQIVAADKAGRLGEVLPGLPGGAPMQGGR